jgi:hypothetical protein
MPIKSKFQYKTEQQLVSNFVDFLNSTKDEYVLIVEEFEGGFGRPDLLLYSAAGAQTGGDVEALKKINPRFAPLLSSSASKKIQSLPDLAAATGSSKISARRIASELIKLDRAHIIESKIQNFKIEPIKQPPFSQIVAIEAKLRDWRRALMQAYRYLQFSTQSWVLLDHKHSSSAIKHLALFKSYGVGLASFSTSGELYVHSMADTQKLSDGPLAWRTQALLARAKNSN